MDGRSKERGKLKSNGQNLKHTCIDTFEQIYTNCLIFCYLYNITIYRSKIWSFCRSIDQLFKITHLRNHIPVGIILSGCTFQPYFVSRQSNIPSLDINVFGSIVVHISSLSPTWTSSLTRAGRDDGRSFILDGHTDIHKADADGWTK